MEKMRIVRGTGFFRKSFLLLTATLIFAGCGAGKTMVIKPPETKIIAPSVVVMEGKSTVNVPDEIKTKFREKLNKQLYEEGGFQKGDAIKIEYRFIQYDPGSQFTRWFWGGIGNAGEGSITIEAKYFDADGREISTIQTEGKISSGFFGGAFELALEKAAKEIAEYTKNNFQ